MINWNIASNPFNWVILLLMVWIGAIGVKIASDYVSSRKGN